MATQKLYTDAVALLKQLIAVQSFSREEAGTSELIHSFLTERAIPTERKQYNVWARNKHFNPALPSILLNSHHDTVKPNKGWTLDPLNPLEEEGKLFGLGSNDAGGCLVSLIATFLYFYPKEGLKYNLILAATAEEEISGANGIESILPELGPIDFAIVGEPTQMQLAIAERGLMVVDCVSHGRSGHAAREEGDNAIYKAVKNIEWIQNFRFPKVSEHFGPLKMSVTIIKAGTQHNVVPDRCEFTIDIRVTDVYRNEEVLAILKEHLDAEVTPRSLRLKSSSIEKTHPIVQAGISLGRTTYVSPTTSDQALLDVPSLKIGPGDSARSHTANEFIHLKEIEEGIALYIQMLEKIL